MTKRQKDETIARFKIFVKAVLKAAGLGHVFQIVHHLHDTVQLNTIEMTYSTADLMLHHYSTYTYSRIRLYSEKSF